MKIRAKFEATTKVVRGAPGVDSSYEIEPRRHLLADLERAAAEFDKARAQLAA